MQSKILTATIIASVVFLMLVGSSTLFVSGYSGSTTLSPSSSALKTVDVTVVFKPNSITGTPNHYSANKVTITNHLKTPYKITSCQFFYKESSSTKYTKATCSVGKGVTIAAGKSFTSTWYTKLPSSGTYDIKVYYTNSVDSSMAGTYTDKVS